MKNTLNVLTFNLKNDSFLTSSKYRWEIRYQYVKSILKTLDYDILGVQELTNQNMASVCLFLTDYHCVGNSRHKNEKQNDELSAIFFKKERFDCISEKTFWLSGKPEKKGSKVLLSIFPRICTIAHLYDKQTQAYFLFVNTHLDHLLPVTRKNQILKLIEIIKTYYSSQQPYLIITGDFNTTLHSTAIKALLAGSLGIEPIYTNDYNNTIHHFNGTINPKKAPIDHIFFDKRLKLLNYRIITNHFNGQYPSDHYPVMATIQIDE